MKINLKKIAAVIISSTIFLVSGSSKSYWVSQEKELIYFRINEDEQFNKRLSFLSCPKTFTAFFIDDNKNYYIWNGTKKTPWMKALSSDKEKLEIYNKEITSENAATLYTFDTNLTEIKFKKINETSAASEKLVSSGSELRNLTLFEKATGCFVIKLRYKNHSLLIKFRDDSNKSAIEKGLSSSSKEDEIKKEVFSKFQKYLFSELTGITEKKYSRMLAGNLYDLFLKTETSGIFDEDINLFRENTNLFNDLYTETTNENYYLRNYLKLAYEKSFPVMGSVYKEKVTSYNPYGFKRISEAEYGKQIALQAEEYVNKALPKPPSKAGWILLKNCMEESRISEKISCIYTEGFREYKSDQDFNEIQLKTSSIIVPDLNQLQKGDIFVYKNSKRNNPAIVIEVPAEKPTEFSDQTDFMKNVKVVACDSSAKKYVLTTMYDLKDKSEGRCVVRRLCTFKGKSSTDISYNFDIFNNQPGDIDISVGSMREETQHSTEKYRWIPNTGEYLLLGKNKINAYNKAGILINDKVTSVNFSGAQDRSFDTEKSDETVYGNIYNNKARKFEVDITNVTNSAHIRGYLEADKNSSSYKFDETETGGNIRILRSGELMLNNSSMIIKIRPENAAQAYPGDDLLLEFSINADGKESKYAVKAEDYIAVYDKKLLWRANQYISKPEQTLNGLDWNIAHPWNVPESSSSTIQAPEWWTVEWGYNDWNSEEIKGGQGKIQSWTRFNDNKNVIDAVAYGYGCGNSVEEFNEGLMKQSDAMLNMKEKNENYPPSGKVFYGITTAPDARWEYYIFPADTTQYKYDGQKLLNKEPEDFFKSDAADEKVKLPGFSTYWVSKDKYDSKQCLYTLGIDCSGLVHISTKYENSRYKTCSELIHNVNAKMLMGKHKVGEDWIDENVPTYSYGIFAANQNDKWNLNPTGSNLSESVKKTRDKHRDLISHAVPGDILVNEGHVVFIQELYYNNNCSIIEDYSQVGVIHSTQKLKDEEETWKVIKGTWLNIQQNVTGYQLRRLKREN